ncbi:hypothetical protein [Flavobacterium sp.]|uniref:hypothetical protein n=1 Tax=Flavobacterium sp. TaxID=239 RepID=UPI003753130D
MKFVKSQLELIDFFIINTKYKFVDAIENNIDVRKLFSEYEMDIDFMPKIRENNQYFVYIKISINEIENPLPGYSLFVEGVCIFNFNDDEAIEEKIKAEYIWSSGISIAINNLRNYISTQTSYFPFGKFNLPAVDLTSLINEKKILMESNKPV